MNRRTKKLIAPIVITVLLILYLLAFVLLWHFIRVPVVIQIAGTVIPLALIGVSVWVLVERINEIRSGEEDDLGKY